MNVKPSHIYFQDAFKKFDKEAEVINFTIFHGSRKMYPLNSIFIQGSITTNQLREVNFNNETLKTIIFSHNFCFVFVQAGAALHRTEPYRS